MAARKKKKFTSEDFLKKTKDLAKEPPFDPIEALASVGVSSPLILVGAEELRLRRVAMWLRDKFFSEENNVSLDSVSGLELNSSNVKATISNLQSLPLFSKLNVLLITHAEAIRSGVAKPLAEAIEQQSGSFTVILSKSLNTRTPLPNALQKVGTVVEISDLKGATLKRWVEREAAKAGSKGGIAPDAIDLLTTVYGTELTTLSMELSKLALLTKPGQKITAKLVRELLTKSPEHTSFELLNAIAGKNVVRAFQLADDLVGQGFHPLQLSNFLSRAYRMMLAQKGTEPAALQSLHSDLTNAWFLRNLKAPMQRFSLAELKRGIEILKQLDMDLKGSKLPDSAVVALTVRKLATRAAPEQQQSAA